VHKTEQAQQHKTDPGRPALKLGTSDLWKDRQLHDYRQANHLCFRCGEKFDPQHQCAKKAELHVLSTTDHQAEISEEVLELLELQDLANAQLELQDLANAQELSLSINALAGSQSDNTICIRALVQNQVMLLLVDSGSSNTFVNANLVNRLNCTMVEIPPVSVKVANGQILDCDRMVPQLQWWAQGHMFQTNMKILPLGGYDAILGVDWLKQWGDMRCNWATKTLKFQQQGRSVTLRGMQSKEQSDLKEMSVEQLLKLTKGNDIWAVAVLAPHTNSAEQ
jgi:hypothetical protein